MITETEFSIQAAKEIPRKEKVKENHSNFQDIFTALTASLQMANSQAANARGIAQNSGNNTGNTVREVSQGSGKKDVTAKRMGQNNPKTADKLFSEIKQNSQEDSKTNNKPLEKDRSAATAQSAKREEAPADSKKDLEGSKPQFASNAEPQEASMNSQDTGSAEKAIKATDPDSNQLLKALQGVSQDSPETGRQLLSMLNGQGSKIEELLVQGGMSEADAKDLLNRIGTQVENSVQGQQALNANLPGNATQVENSVQGQQALNANPPGNATQVENSVQGQQALNANPPNNATKMPVGTVSVTNDSAGPDIATGSVDKNIELPPGNLPEIPQEQTNAGKTDGKKDIGVDLSSKPGIKDRGADVLADKGKEDLPQTFSPGQPYNIFSSQDSSSQDTDARIQELAKGSKDISGLPAKVSEPVKTTSDTPNSLFADLSPKSINETNRVHAPQEIMKSVEKPVIHQIIEKFSLRTAGQQNEINIKLDPPDLGTVRINITSEGDNVKTTLITENHAVKQAIESNLGQLRDAMSDQGLKVQSFTVLVGGNQGHKGQGHQQQQQSPANLSGAPFQESSQRPENDGPLLAGRPGVFGKSQSISVFA